MSTALIRPDQTKPNQTKPKQYQGDGHQTTRVLVSRATALP